MPRGRGWNEARGDGTKCQLQALPSPARVIEHVAGVLSRGQPKNAVSARRTGPNSRLATRLRMRIAQAAFASRAHHAPKAAKVYSGKIGAGARVAVKFRLASPNRGRFSEFERARLKRSPANRARSRKRFTPFSALVWNAHAIDTSLLRGDDIKQKHDAPSATYLHPWPPDEIHLNGGAPVVQS